MSKWICITKDISMLTYGKIYYDISNQFVDKNCILIMNDFGIVTEYFQPGIFVDIQEWRNSQLEDLGI
jgi:histidinol phosphatase-like enzyme